MARAEGKKRGRERMKMERCFAVPESSMQPY
jgi:hypothetical protein